MSSTDLLQLAWDLESHGFAGRDAAVRAVVRAARAACVSSVVVDVLADVDAPEVARLRAFGHIASALSFRADGAPAVPVAA